MCQEAEKWEGLCRQCGISCHAAVMVDGRNLVVEGLHCINLRGATCSVYTQRRVEAPWCLPAQIAGAVGALAEDCPYVVQAAVRGPCGPTTGKIRLPSGEYSKLFPLITEAICAMRLVASHFSWAEFFSHAEEMQPEYEWLLCMPTTGTTAVVSRRLVPSGPSRPNPSPQSRIMLPWSKPCNIDDLAKCTLPDWEKCLLPEGERCPKPQEGWEAMYKAQKGGQAVWEVPGHPEADKVVPWPIEWIPHRELTEEDKKRGFIFLDTVCTVTGQEAKMGVGVCCVRCGAHLHHSAANMAGGFDPPHCDKCKIFVMWA